MDAIVTDTIVADEVLENPEMWEAFWDGRASDTREQLILQYVPLVKYVVGRLAISLPHFLTSEDIVSYGVVGLIDAIERYERGRNVKFSTYAIVRIRGAIIDALRSLDWMPRQVRKQARDIEEAMRRLDQDLGRPASERELAQSMGVTVQKLQRALFEASASTVSLNRLVDSGTSDHSSQIMPEIADENALDPLNYSERKELTEALAVAISQLTLREQQVLSLYYADELNLREIGQVLQVSESRVCQLHTKAILRLRGTLPRIISGLPADDVSQPSVSAPSGSEASSIRGAKRRQTAPAASAPLAEVG